MPNQVATQVPLVLEDSVTPWVMTLQEFITLCVNRVLGLQVIRIVELVWKCLFTDVACNELAFMLSFTMVPHGRIVLQFIAIFASKERNELGANKALSTLLLLVIDDNFI